MMIIATYIMLMLGPPFILSLLAGTSKRALFAKFLRDPSALYAIPLLASTHGQTIIGRALRIYVFSSRVLIFSLIRS